jgi:hypothetical protein
VADGRQKGPVASYQLISSAEILGKMAMERMLASTACNFAGHCCVVALGIGIDTTKHPLAVEEGSTEKVTLVTNVLVG